MAAYNSFTVVVSLIKSFINASIDHYWVSLSLKKYSKMYKLYISITYGTHSKIQTLFSFYSQIKCRLSGLEFTNHLLE